MKKILLVILTLIVAFSLSACYEGVINSELKITSKTGAGQKTLSLLVYKDTAEKPGEPGKKVEENSKYLPNGTDAIVNKLKSVCKLKDAVIKKTVNKDYDLITITYSFKNIAEYNKKTKTLADGAKIVDATISSKGNMVTFKEATENFENSIKWAINAVYSDKKVYDPQKGDPSMGAIKKEEFCRIHNMTVVVGNKSAKVDFADARKKGEDPVQYITVTGDITKK